MALAGRARSSCDSPGRIYVTGSETASVFEQRDADHYEHIAEVPTAYRAKSSIFVPELKRLYVADSGKGKPDAKLALKIVSLCREQTRPVYYGAVLKAKMEIPGSGSGPCARSSRYPADSGLVAARPLTFANWEMSKKTARSNSGERQ